MIDTAVVDAVGVGVRLGSVPILRGLDLTVRTGEAVAITGPNGSGKSTLLRLLATLLRPSDGNVRLFGVGGRATTAPGVRRRIGHVGHEPALHPDLSLGENLHLVARLAACQPAAVDRALTTVGLAGAAGRPVRACSAGMRRRAELARILLCRPQLLLLDEAHAALDAASRDLVDQVGLGAGRVSQCIADFRGADIAYRRSTTVACGKMMGSDGRLRNLRLQSLSAA